MRTMRLIAVLIGLVIPSLPGCGTPTQRVDPDQDDSVGGTGIDSADVRATAANMAQALLNQPQLFAKGTPYVVIDNPDNRTRFQIDDSIFVNRLRSLLLENAQGRIRFIGRDSGDIAAVEKERELKRRGAVSVPTDAEGKPDLAAAPLGTTFFLRGTIQAISKQGDGAVSDYVQVSFRLLDAETSELIWEKAYDWKKVGESGVLYH